MLEQILEKYNIEGNLIDYTKINSGNINKTYVSTFEKDGTKKKYLIQKINTKGFTEPFKLMKNIEGVTRHLKKEMIKEGDTDHKVLEVIKTKNNKPLCYITNESDTREYYRIYEFIENAIAYDESTNKGIVYNTGKAFGNFQKLLRDYPMSKLEETIKDFHNTPERYKKLMYDIKIDPEGRAIEAAEEIVYILQKEEYVYTIMEDLKTKRVPYRVTHNDTKVNNVMMNKDTGDFLAVIDLDTVMPGSMLFDYGDGIRSTASTSTEDEKDLSKVSINLELFKAYTDGYLSEMAPYLEYEEVSLMAESILIITLELAIRFLDDYINGDTYFKTNYEGHNLDRTRNQLKLVEDIERKLEYMNNYILESFNKYRKNNKNNTRVLKR